MAGFSVEARMTAPMGVRSMTEPGGEADDQRDADDEEPVNRKDHEAQVGSALELRGVRIGRAADSIDQITAIVIAIAVKAEIAVYLRKGK